jgi:hypothetical protein
MMLLLLFVGWFEMEDASRLSWLVMGKKGDAATTLSVV